MTARWLCRCDCGKEHIVNSRALVKGLVQSCGCLRVDANRAKIKHGLTRVGVKKPPEYNSWSSSRTRCVNPNNQDWDDYGGRGIVMCQRWMGSFVDFFADMGTKPTPKHWLDRIDTDGNYSCGKCEQCVANNWTANCRWATIKEQQNNKRNSRLITWNGKTQTLAEWAEETGINYGTLLFRIDDCKWPIEEALEFAPHVHGQTRLTAADHKIRKAARMSVKNEIKTGRLLPIRFRDCFQCGEPAMQYHHHRGYEKPHHIDVIPLCHACHGIATKDER
jgi:hypothetical protein